MRFILIIILLSGCAKDLDFNPFTTFLRVVHKGQFDDTRVKALEINKEIINITPDEIELDKLELEPKSNLDNGLTK